MHVGAQRMAFDELGHYEIEGINLPDFMNGEDIRMVQRGGDVSFSPEPSQPVCVLGELCGQQLQRDAPIEAKILSEEDITHPSLSYVSYDPVGADVPSYKRSTLIICKHLGSDDACHRLDGIAGLIVGGYERLYFAS
jgi:hypothetical protein